MKIFGFEIKSPRSAFTERRRGERIRVFETLFLDYQSPVHPAKGRCEARDISEVGLRFSSTSKIPKGTPLELNLRFAQSSPVKADLRVWAKVTRCDKKFGQKWYKIGCEFDPLDPVTCSQIQAFVNWLKEQKEKNLFFRWREPGEEQ